jgi:simple sugar transport system permease protein
MPKLRAGQSGAAEVAAAFVTAPRSDSVRRGAQETARVGLAVGAGVLVAAGFVAALGYDPFAAVRVMFETVFRSRSGFVDTVLQATPLLLIALGYALAFRARVWTVGGEGQFHLGAAAAGLVALGLPAATPAPLGLTLAVAAAILAGTAWAYVPGWLRARRGVNEVVSTLMLNFVGIFVMGWLIRTVLRDPDIPLLQTPAFPEAFRFPAFDGSRLHLGVVLAVALVPVVGYLAQRATFGARAQAIGANPRASRAAGVDVPGTIIALFVVSGALAGLAGAVHVLGVTHRLLVGLSHDFGYTAVLVALLARNHPVAAIPAAFLFSALVVGAEGVQVELRIPSDFVRVLMGIVVLFVLAADALARRRTP